MTEHRKGLIERILDGEAIFPVLARRDLTQRGEVSAEEIIQRWREAGVPDEAIDMAVKMSDNWLKKMME